MTARFLPRKVWWLSPGIMLWMVAASAGVDFVPTAKTGFAHTDNLTLSSKNPEPETVYLLTPGFTLNQKSTRVTTNIDYQMDGFYYWNRDIADVYHQFNGDFSLALDPDNFFLQMGGRRTQTLVNPAGPVFTSNLPVTTNRTNRDDFYVGPMFQYTIGPSVTARGSYRHTWLSYDDNLQGDSPLYSTNFESDQGQFSVDNYRRGHGFTWAARLNSSKTDYHRFKPWQSRQASVELGFWASQTVRLFASGGKESAWDKPFDPTLADDFWEAGVAITASRFTAEFAAGDRSYGASRRAKMNFKFLHGEMGLSYTENPTTQGRNAQDRLGLGGLPSQLLLPGSDYLSDVGSVQRYLEKRFDWHLGFQMRRTNFDLTLFNEERDDRLRIDGMPLPNEKQRGVRLSAKMQVGVHTDVTLEGRHSRWDRGFGNEHAVDSYAVTGDYKLGERTTVSLELRHAAQKVIQGAGVSYDANIISLMVSRKFGRDATAAATR